MFAWNYITSLLFIPCSKHGKLILFLILNIFRKKSPVIYTIWIKRMGWTSIPPYLIHMSHIKMTIFPADWSTIMHVRFTYYRPLSSVVFLWIYKPMHRTYLFIANGADVENTKNIKCHEGWCCFGVYILEKKEIEVKMLIYHNLESVSWTSRWN